MKLITRMLQQTPQIGLCRVLRKFSTYNPYSGTDDKWKSNSVESADDFVRRMFGNTPGNGENSVPFYQELDRAQKNINESHRFTGNIFGQGTNFNAEDGSGPLDWLETSFTTTEDGMDEKLKDAAQYFEVNEKEEIDDAEERGEDWHFRPDVDFHPGNTYDIKDLDLRKPGIQKPPRRNEFETTTEEVLKKADFRNVRFLANFITDGGIIFKRSQTKISAKAQRKIAREIKTARAFGLLPFTTMGTKQFAYGRTMETTDEDFESQSYQSYRPYNFVDNRRGGGF